MRPKVQSVLLVLACALLAAASTTGADELSYPLNVLEDEGSFTFYLNEEVLVTGTFTWEKDGTFSSNYTLTMAGQTVSTTLEILVNGQGDWTKMFMETPFGPRDRHPGRGSGNDRNR